MIIFHDCSNFRSHSVYATQLAYAANVHSKVAIPHLTSSYQYTTSLVLIGTNTYKILHKTHNSTTKRGHNYNITTCIILVIVAEKCIVKCH